VAEIVWAPNALDDVGFLKMNGTFTARSFMVPIESFIAMTQVPSGSLRSIIQHACWI
jgi:hypothetical protein